MAKMQIEKGEATTTASKRGTVSVADLRKAFGIPDDAVIEIVTAKGTAMLDDDAVIVSAWTETKPVRARKKSAA